MSDSYNDIPAYRGNPLIAACGPIYPPEDLVRRLACIPEPPTAILSAPLHVRRHMVSAIWDLHIPCQSGLQVAQTVDLMLRQGYVTRRPGTPEFWQSIFSPRGNMARPIAAAVVGIPGVGKSVAIERALSIYPRYVDHDRFPGFVSGFRQLLWLKIDAPNSGRSVDLATNLMAATDQALETNYFEDELSRIRKRSFDLFRAWHGIAAKHSLGILVIDEIQNLFKLAPVSLRRRTVTGSDKRRELRIVEDEALKQILSATNTWGIPILISGTPDGMEAFNARLSTMQRLMTHGQHIVHRSPSADEGSFKQSIFPILCKYQWVNSKLEMSDEFRQLVFDLSGGVPRLLKCLWLAAHRFAFEGNRDKLTLADFKNGFNRYLQPLAPAVEALRTNSSRRLELYEDVLPKNSAFWEDL